MTLHLLRFQLLLWTCPLLSPVDQACSLILPFVAPVVLTGAPFSRCERAIPIDVNFSSLPTFSASGVPQLPFDKAKNSSTRLTSTAVDLQLAPSSSQPSASQASQLQWPTLLSFHFPSFLFPRFSLTLQVFKFQFALLFYRLTLNQVPPSLHFLHSTAVSDSNPLTPPTSYSDTPYLPS